MSKPDRPRPSIPCGKVFPNGPSCCKGYECDLCTYIKWLEDRSFAFVCPDCEGTHFGSNPENDTVSCHTGECRWTGSYKENVFSFP